MPKESGYNRYMKFQFTQAAENEIKRLLELGFGFDEYFLDNHKVFVKESNKLLLDSFQANFPILAYEQEWMKCDLSWGYVRAHFIHKILTHHSINLIWEIGAGNGLVSNPLHQRGITVIASDPIYEGLKVTASKGVPSFHGTLESLNLPKSSLPAVGLFDVLEHLENPKRLLLQVREKLESGGFIAVTVPAHQWLFSDFDYAIGHFRRYNKKSLHHLLDDAGFEKVQIRYFFSLLVLPALLIRTIPSLFGKQRSFESQKEILYQTTVLNSFASRFAWIIKPILFLDIKLRLPFGLSLIALYRKI